MEYHSTSLSQSPAAVILNDFSLLVLRLIAGLPMLYFQAWHQSFRAWAFVWEKKSWSFAAQFDQLGFSMPGFFATGLVILCTLLSIAIVTGIYTRISACLMLILIAFILIVPVELSGSLNVQALLLYTGMSFALLLSGGGRISLDHLLSGKNANKA